MIRRAGLAMVAILVAITLYGETAKRVALRVRSIDAKGQSHEGVGFSGQTLRLTATVPKDATNRHLATAVECDNYFRSWQEQLNGDAADYARETNLARMPAGYCVVGVTVYWADRSKKSGIEQETATAQMCFIGGDYSCQ